MQLDSAIQESDFLFETKKNDLVFVPMNMFGPKVMMRNNQLMGYQPA